MDISKLIWRCVIQLVTQGERIDQQHRLPWIFENIRREFPQQLLEFSDGSNACALLVLLFANAKVVELLYWIGSNWLFLMQRNAIEQGDELMGHEMHRRTPYLYLLMPQLGLFSSIFSKA